MRQLRVATKQDLTEGEQVALPDFCKKLRLKKLLEEGQFRVWAKRGENGADTAILDFASGGQIRFALGDDSWRVGFCENGLVFLGPAEGEYFSLFAVKVKGMELAK